MLNSIEVLSSKVEDEWCCSAEEALVEIGSLAELVPYLRISESETSLICLNETI